MRRLTDAELTDPEPADANAGDPAQREEEPPAEVGLRLALADGVSAAVAAIGGELAALQRAVADGGIELARLQALGGAAQAVSGAVPPASAGEAAVPGTMDGDGQVAVPPAVADRAGGMRPADVAAPARALPDAAADRVAVAAGLPPATAPVADVAMVAATAPVAVAAVAPVAERAAAAPVAAVAPVADVAPGGAAAPVAAMAPQGPSGAVGPGGAPGSRALPVPLLSMFAPAAMAAPGLPMTQRDEPVVAEPVAVDGAAARGAADEPAARQVAMAFAGMGEPALAPAASADAGAMAARPMAPVAPRQDAAPAAAKSAGSAAAKAAEGDAPEAAAGPVGGDVILDGMRMGRWIATTLARAASQPQSGSTMHDPRMGPVFPGSLQGG